MSNVIPKELRRLVIERARGNCEYCLIHRGDAIIPHQIDHVIALKHHGKTIFENLALACLECNLHKGTDLATMDWQTNEIVPLFNPRRHRWVEHFRFDGIFIAGVTAIGIATVSLLQVNSSDRVEFRQDLADAGFYPPTDFMNS